jgi:hypothetical protein
VKGMRNSSLTAATRSGTLLEELLALLLILKPEPTTAVSLHTLLNFTFTVESMEHTVLCIQLT